MALKVAKPDLRLNSRTGVHRRLERDGMGREAWWWFASSNFGGKQRTRRWAVTAHGDRESAPVLDIRDFLDGVILATLTGNADAHAKNFSILYGDGKRRMTPLYDQVFTLAWPELSQTLSMKIGSARSLAEVSPEHFKQLSAEAKLGWPMVRERLAELYRKTSTAIRSDEIPAISQVAAETTLARGERMLRLMDRRN